MKYLFSTFLIFSFLLLSCAQSKKNKVFCPESDPVCANWDLLKKEVFASLPKDSYDLSVINSCIDKVTAESHQLVNIQFNKFIISSDFDLTDCVKEYNQEENFEYKSTNFSLVSQILCEGSDFSSLSNLKYSDLELIDSVPRHCFNSSKIGIKKVSEKIVAMQTLEPRMDLKHRVQLKYHAKGSEEKDCIFLRQVDGTYKQQFLCEKKIQNKSVVADVVILLTQDGLHKNSFGSQDPFFLAGKQTLSFTQVENNLKTSFTLNLEYSGAYSPPKIYDKKRAISYKIHEDSSLELVY